MTRLLVCSSFVVDALATGLSMTGIGGGATTGAWVFAGLLTVAPFAYYMLTIMLMALRAPQVLTLDDLQPVMRSTAA